MEHNSRMKEITGNLKQDVKDLLGESAAYSPAFSNEEPVRSGRWRTSGKHLPTIFPPLWTT